MSILQSIAGLFSRSGREDSLMQQGMAHAKAKQPDKALAVYNKLLAASSTTGQTRARALFNRALAYSSLDDDQKAIADLEQVLAMADVPDNVESAARSQLARVRRRNAEK
jgi:tetratricopeptide (TPR) repeat protein